MADQMALMELQKAALMVYETADQMADQTVVRVLQKAVPLATIVRNKITIITNPT